MKTSKKSVIKDKESFLTPEFLPPNLQTVIENLGAAVCTVDLKFRYTSFNGIHAKNIKTLYNKDVNFGINILDLITNPEDKENVKQFLFKALEGIKSVESQFYGDNGDRQSFAVTYTPIRGTDGNITGVAILALNETPLMKEKEERLKTEERLRLVLKSSELGYIDWNVPTNKFIYSEQVYKILGYEKINLNDGEEDISSWLKMIHPHCKKHIVLSLYQSIGNSDELFSLEFRMKNTKNAWQWLHLSGKVVARSPEGKPLRFLGTLWDVSKEKQKDLKLQLVREKNEALLTMHKRSRDPNYDVFDETLDAVVKITRSQFGYIYLYSEETKIFTLHSWSTAVMPQCQVMDKKTLYNLDKTGLWGEVVRQRKTIIINDYASDNPLKKGTPVGHVRLKRFLTVPIFDDKKIVAVTGVANKEDPYTQDDSEALTLLLEEVWIIHQRQDTEKKLGKLFRAVESSPESILITDQKGNIEYVNPKFTTITGYTSDEVLGKNPHILASGLVNPLIFKDLWATITQGKEWAGELINRKKTGEIFYESVAISSVKDNKGNITNYIAVKEDITLKKNLQDSLFQSQKMETVGQLAAGIAHDFNNLLTSLMGFNTMFLLNLPVDSKLYQYAERMELVGKRAAELVSGLLSVGRRQRLQIEPLNLDEFIKSQMLLTHAMASSNRGTFVIEWKPETPDRNVFIFGDSGQLSQVLLNLLSNAQDAQQGEGKSVITWGSVLPLEETVHRLGLVEGQSYGYFSITDQGPGIPMEIQRKIFEPFFTTKPVGEGTGIGLAAVFGIMKQHQGAVDLFSELGKGAKFTIYIPQASASSDSIPS